MGLHSGSKTRVLEYLTYGLHVVTAAAGERYAASTITWLSQASFNPPLVMMAVRKKSGLHAILQESNGFVVHTVGNDQQEFAAAFFKHVQHENGRLNGYSFDVAPNTAAPVFHVATAWFEARVVQRLPGGDHDVFLAEVISESIIETSLEPLALRDTPWKYRR